MTNRKCKHDWFLISPPHREQKCTQCGERRLEPQTDLSLEQIIYKTVWEAIPQEGINNLAQVIRKWIRGVLPTEMCKCGDCILCDYQDAVKKALLKEK